MAGNPPARSSSLSGGKRNIEYYEYLDELRRSGVTNMYGAPAYLEAAFDLDRRTAKDVATDWMETFGDRREAGETGD